jgi:hypothetical protein
LAYCSWHGRSRVVSVEPGEIVRQTDFSIVDCSYPAVARDACGRRLALQISELDVQLEDWQSKHVLAKIVCARRGSSLNIPRNWVQWAGSM